MRIAIELPDDIADRMRQSSGADLSRQILEAYALQAYQERTLGESHLRRLLGFATRYEFEDFLVAHHIPRNYTLDDLERDRESSRRLGL